jgi:hypothetical protein
MPLRRISPAAPPHGRSAGSSSRTIRLGRRAQSRRRRASSRSPSQGSRLLRGQEKERQPDDGRSGDRRIGTRTVTSPAGSRKCSRVMPTPMRLSASMKKWSTSLQKHALPVAEATAPVPALRHGGRHRRREGSPCGSISRRSRSRSVCWAPGWRCCRSLRDHGALARPGAPPALSSIPLPRFRSDSLGPVARNAHETNLR